MKHDIFSALISLRPGKNFSWDPTVGGYAGIDYQDKDTCPSEAELNAEIARLDTEYANKKYQRDRATAYPSIQDQLDMQYWDKKNGTTTWVDAIAKVKSDNPKP